MKLIELSAVDAAAAIREGTVSSEELVQAYLQHIAPLEETIGAWEYLSPEHALEQARDADLYRRSGKTLGPLHGVPVGVKDIFDTSDMPTQDGTPLHAGRTPAYDAAAVSRLREAGAIILGKTVTTELAVYGAGKTRNPHDPNRTPGGSSSGSAAAVAAQMVPLAIGTQTNGSTIRPASFCGVVGYKPSYGLISRFRALQQSHLLDHVGVFGRSVPDVALIAENLMGFDERDPATQQRCKPNLLELASGEPLVPPRLAFVKTPAWAKADEATREGFGELADFLGTQVVELDLDDLLANTYDWHRTIMETNLANSFRREYERGKQALSPMLCEMIERGQQTLAIDYQEAVDQIAPTRSGFDEILLEYDAILTPATLGEAPQGLESTGDPAFCTPWTYLGMPTISLPLLQGENGMPVGVQLVAAKGDDARLLRIASWLAKTIATA